MRIGRYARTYLSDISNKELFKGGTRFSYYDVGRGPVVLLIHGFNGTKIQWRMFMQALIGRYRLIALDVPGFVFDDTLTSKGEYSLRPLLSHLDEFVQALKLKSFHLMGHSAGSTLAAFYALENPEYVESLSLMAMPAFFKDPDDPLSIYTHAVDTYLPLTPEGIDRLLHFLYETPPRLPQYFLNRYIHVVNEHRGIRMEVLQEIFRQTGMLVPRLRKLQVPALYLYGDKDKITPQSSVDYLAAKVPAIQLHRLESTGHIPCIEKPKESAAIFESFVRFCERKRLTNATRG